MNNSLRVASFFSGIGGFDLGLERAGMKVVFQCEINEFCKKVLKKHWPQVPLKSDILELKSGDIPEAELWVGGFPCQDVSLANQGKRKGLEGFRSGLFYKYAELIAERKPRWILVENVPGLLNSKNGKDFEAVISALDELGYCVSWRILDAKYFGTPQRRRRVYVVASFGTIGSAEVLFEPDANQQVYRAGLGKKDLVASEFGIGLGKESYYLLQHATIGRKATAGPQAKGYRNDGEAYTLDSRGSSDVVCSTATPFGMREATGLSARLDGNRYRAVGNAVAVPIIEWIGNRINEVDTSLYKGKTAVVYDFDYASISTAFPSRVSKIPANMAGYGSP
ncbi:MAG: DNA (cytosine-5-)-methyltransferase [Spirochaetales bacterium]|jgi:DNA (cytosine-5)-methyltransferase 1|nr:DNA (cytosine-5-)-methyltransferase [Spirochaetales bacterium]